MKAAFFSFFHILFGLIALGALFYDLGRSDFQVFKYFSFFSNQCVAITAVIFLYLGVVKKDIDSARGALVAYMLIVAGMYAFLLSKIDDPNRNFLIDFIYHKLLPGAAYVGWIIFPPSKTLKYTNIFLWLIYPLVYVVLTLLRGIATNWYPYYFFNPANSSYLKILTFSIEVVFVGFTISVFLILSGNFLKRRY